MKKRQKFLGCSSYGPNEKKKREQRIVLYNPHHTSFWCPPIGKHLPLFGHHVKPFSANENDQPHRTNRYTQNAESKIEFFFLMKRPRPKSTSGSLGLDRAGHRRPIFFFLCFGKLKHVTDVLLLFRHRPFPTTVVLRAISRCFHRCHRIAVIFEQLA